MMSVSPAKTAAGAAQYFKEEDYFFRREKAESEWIGGAAREFDLEGKPTAKNFRALADGFDPNTGEKLAQNAGEDDRRAGWDVTFSAPKSVSSAWGAAVALGDHKTARAIEKAHNDAVKRGFALFEEKAGFGRTSANERVRADLVAATFRHGTSREGEPQLHTHTFVFNVGQTVDGRHVSIDSREMMMWQKAGGAAYRAALAENLREKGFQTERDGDFFKMIGVSDKLCDDWSTRRAQIEERMAETGATGAKAAEIAALDTRQSKADIEVEKLTAQWAEKALEHGFTVEKIQALQTYHYDAEKTAEALGIASPKQILEMATVTKTSARECDVYEKAMIESVGNSFSSGLAVAECAKFEGVDFVKRGEKVWTTHEIVNSERLIVDSVAVRQDEERHRISETSYEAAIARFEAEKGFSPSLDQRLALRAGASGDGVSVVVGYAGAGKTTAMTIMRDAHEREGYRVIGIAPTGKVADALRAEAAPEAYTLAKACIDLEKGKLELNEKTLIMVDESAMAGSVETARLVDAANAAGAKVVFIGDNEQTQSVAAGSYFRHAAAEAGERTTELTQNFRQQNSWEKDTVLKVREGDATTAFSKYKVEGRLHIAQTTGKAIRDIARDTVDDIREKGVKSTIAIATTNGVVDKINSEIREALKQDGFIAECATVVTADNKEIEVGTGDRIVFTDKNHPDEKIFNGTFATVEKVNENGNLEIIKDKTCEWQEIDPSKFEFKHGFAATIYKFQGSEAERSRSFVTPEMSKQLTYTTVTRGKAENHVYSSVNAVKSTLTDKELTAMKEQGEKLTPELAAEILAAKVSRDVQKESTLDHLKRRDVEVKKDRETLRERINEKQKTLPHKEAPTAEKTAPQRDAKHDAAVEKAYGQIADERKAAGLEPLDSSQQMRAANEMAREELKIPKVDGFVNDDRVVEQIRDTTALMVHRADLREMELREKNPNVMHDTIRSEAVKQIIKEADKAHQAERSASVGMTRETVADRDGPSLHDKSHDHHHHDHSNDRGGYDY